MNTNFINGGMNAKKIVGGVQYHYIVRQSTGEVVTKVGVGTDGTLWMQPAALGIRAEMLDAVTKELMDFPRMTVMLDVDDGRLYVNVQAYAETQVSEEERRRMLDWADRWLDQLHPTNYRK
jgi:hypothetical protein